MSEADLTDFIEKVTGDNHLRVEDDLGDGFVRLRSAEAERRQAKHDIRSSEDIIIEMLRNARDAGAHTIFVASSKEGSTRHITMIDDGDGVPAGLHSLVFEPRVTSKLDSVHMDTWGVHGRGMALYSIRVNTQVAKIASSGPGLGSAFVIESDTTQLTERRDQSTKPVFFKDDKGVLHIRGPRNIARTVAEFAYMDRESCTVYFGTPIEIAATLFHFGTAITTSFTRAFCDDLETLDVCKRLSTCATPEHFAEVAASIGLELSPRSARRILDGQIACLEEVAEGIVVSSQRAAAPAKHPRKHDLNKDSRGLKIAPVDRKEFTEDIKRAFADLAEKYYLVADVDPSVTFANGRIAITIPVTKED